MSKQYIYISNIYIKTTKKITNSCVRCRRRRTLSRNNNIYVLYVTCVGGRVCIQGACGADGEGLSLGTTGDPVRKEEASGSPIGHSTQKNNPQIGVFK